MFDMFDLDREMLQEQRLEYLKCYAARNPMRQLEDKYRVTPSNPNPPLVHFAFPVPDAALISYATKHNWEFSLSISDIMATLPTVLLNIVAIDLEKTVNHKVVFVYPFEHTRDPDCPYILSLYTNYTTEKEKKKIFKNKSERDVIEEFRGALGLLEPKWDPQWHFELSDWTPEDEERKMKTRMKMKSRRKNRKMKSRRRGYGE